MKKLKKFISMLLIATFMISFNVNSSLKVYAASNEETIYNYMRNTMGVNCAVACGVLANIKAESNFNPTASCIDTNGLTSYGICQWNGGRFTNLKNYCSNRGLSYNNINAQLQFLKYELEGSESSAWSKVKDQSNTASGAYTAGYNWAKYFERCASSYYTSRANSAQNTYWPKYHGEPTPTLTVDSKYNAVKGFKAYPCVTSNFEVKTRDLSTRGGEIYTTDFCTINELYTNGWCKVTFPMNSGGTRTAYTQISKFINTPSASLSKYTASSYINLYSTSSLSTQIYRIYPGDVCYTIGTSGSATQIFMPMSSGGYYVLGWVSTGALSPTPTSEKLNPGLTSLSSSSYAKCYTVTNGRYNVYTSSALSKRGYEGNESSTAWTGEVDEIWIIGVGVNDAGTAYAKIKYPVGDSRYTAYVPLHSTLVPGSLTGSYRTAIAKVTGFSDRSGGSTNSSYWVDSGEKVYLLSQQNGYSQILYPTSSGAWRIAWCTNSVYDSMFQAQTYTVSYNANGGTGAPSSQTKTRDVDLTLSSVKPSRAGYVFVGWATGSSATTAQYSAGSIYTNEASVTLYAVWIRQTFTITYDANGGSGTPSSQTKIYDSTLILSSTTPTREGYEFLGWATSATASTAAYKAGASYTSNSPATLYAVWKANTYTISYNANGGTNAPSSQIKTYDVPLNLASKVPTRKGYIFIGWSIQVDNDDIVYAPGETVYFDSDVTLFALWSTISVSSISIETMPAKTTYKIGDSLDTSGLKLKLAYSDGTTESITSGFTTSGFSSATAGTKTVTVSYGGKTTSFTVVVESTPIDENTPQIMIEKNTAKAGETVEVQFKIQNAPKLKSFSITGLTYDTNKLKFEKAVCNIAGVAISQVLPNGNAIAALNNNTDINGLIFTYTFTVKENVEDCSIPISCAFSAKEKPDGGVEQTVAFTVVAGEITIKNYIVGDLNGDDVVDSDDSIYLLWYTYFPDDYPINQNADFNGDGVVDSDDSIYLLWYTYLPDDYPLS